jgi:uncharacterized protein YndB with AHSA1/START domain
MVLIRRFAAPLADVWLAWTDPAQVKRWWGPAGFTAPVANMDVRAGGTSLVCMGTPDAHDLCNTWTYRGVEPMTRLDFVLRFADQDGNPVTPASIGLPPEIPAEVPHVVALRSVSEHETELTVTESGYPSAEIVELSRLGISQCLDKMAALFAAP